MHHNHQSVFIGLSIVVAVLGSWTALDLFRRVRSHIGRTRAIWLGAAAVAMGLSIWSMHFIAMLGFDPGSPVSYDLPLTFLSLALAMGATCGAFFAASRERAPTTTLLIAGLAMGLGICLMHYVGMAALRTAVSLGYRPAYVAASFVIAVVASTAALLAKRQSRGPAWRAIAAIVLGLAIVGMHYTAMAGLKLVPGPAAADFVPGAPPFILGVSVAAGTLVILVLGLLASLYDQRLNVLAALDAGRVGYWELTLPDRTLHMSQEGREILGLHADAPFARADFLTALAPDELDRSQRRLNRAIESGEEYDAEYRLRDTPAGATWINVRGRVVAWSRGKPRRMVGVLLDVTERRRAFAALAEAEARQRLLIDELNHRVKNTLATVQSIARQTAKGAPPGSGFVEAFEGRLIALSRTHDALTRGAWEQASLRELLETESAPYAAGQFRLEGPEVSVRPKQALALGMVFHELATNAAKHGALSRHGGCVEVSWEVRCGVLHIEWRERDGPPVAPPSRRGFGSRLIGATIEGELGGAVEIDYPPAGVVCRLKAPLGEAAAEQARAAAGS